MMHHKTLLKLDRLAMMPKHEALATLTYLCKIGEPDFAQRLAARNPQWGLEIVNGFLQSTEPRTARELQEVTP